MSKKFKIWLDDERDPNDQGIQEQFGSTPDMLWIKNPDELEKMLFHGEIESISFDHDLGLIDSKWLNVVSVSGYDLAKKIEELAFNGKIPRIRWRVHSMNPVGVREIKVAMSNADRHWTRYELIDEKIG